MAGIRPLSRDLFLSTWLTEYLPLIRVIPPHPSHLAMLSPAEAQRIRALAGKDPDDVPSATLALLLEAPWTFRIEGVQEVIADNSAEIKSFEPSATASGHW